MISQSDINIMIWSANQKSVLCNDKPISDQKSVLCNDKPITAKYLPVAELVDEGVLTVGQLQPRSLVLEWEYRFIEPVITVQCTEPVIIVQYT